MPTLAHRTKLQGRPDGIVYLVRAAGLRRLAYNWALAESKRHYAETGKSLTGYDLVKRFNEIKDARYPWCREFSKWIPQLAQMSCWDAFKRFFKLKKGFPRFKRKGRAPDSFQVGQEGCHVDPSGRAFRLAGSAHRYRITNPIRFPGRILRTTIRREPDGWWVSFLVEIDSSQWSYPHGCKTQAAVGLDLGILRFCTTWDGSGEEFYQAPVEQLDRLDKRTRQAQKVLARRRKGSGRYRQQAHRVANLQAKGRRVRTNWLHGLSASLVTRYRVICVENLNIQGMVQNHRLARSISSQAWGQFVDLLTYKAELAGGQVVTADRWFPSSKTCSACGAKRDLTLSDRQWACPCGARHDRDVNAAKNLYRLAAGGHPEALNARGELVRPDGKVACDRPSGRSSMKRESESFPVK
jgi:putative transposase